MMTTDQNNFFDSKVLGHPAGLFVLFFTEMWERFSYYGMRALLVLFLVSSFGLGGWDWPREHALALYGTYTAMVYLTPILGGFLADKYIGYRKAVVIGAIIMTMGHASMAIESAHIFLYLGIGLLIIGNGFFKPNMTSIISHMYKDFPEKKDGAYTIFYMGVNAGAFLGILLCGYLGEKVGWSYGFGLAGIFMFLGMLQFYFAQKIFGDIGTKPVQTENVADNASNKLEFEGDKVNTFTTLDKILVGISAVIGISWVINDPIATVTGKGFLSINGTDYSNYYILVGLFAFLFLLISRIMRYHAIIRDRMIAIILFAIFTVMFWMCFEQAGGSMTIFANDYTQRIMSGNSATIFLIVNILITVIPVMIITWVLFQLFRRTYKKFLIANIILGTSFVIIWGIIFWMINRDLNSSSYVLEYDTIKTAQLDENNQQVKDEKTGELVYNYTAITESTKVNPKDEIVKNNITIIDPDKYTVGDKMNIIDIDKKGSYLYLNKEKEQKLREGDRLTNKESLIIPATISKIKENEVEIPATWFLILNSLFIIAFAPLFSKWWESKFNPAASVKYGLGLVLLGIGFGALAMGSMGIEQGAKVASVSLVWLVIAYLFHTLGELCLSPVALSYISKLVPGRMIAMMFGIWYIAIAIGNKLAGTLGGQIDKITEKYDLSTFFLIFTIAPIILGLLAMMLSPLIKKLMHGVK